MPTQHANSAALWPTAFHEEPLALTFWEARMVDVADRPDCRTVGPMREWFRHNGQSARPLVLRSRQGAFCHLGGTDESIFERGHEFDRMLVRHMGSERRG